LPVPPLRPGEARFGADPAIIVYPLSKGTLLFGGALDPERPLAILHKQLKVTSDDPDNRDVYIDQRAADDTDIPGRYVVSFDVWNYRDSPVTAQITRMDPADVAAESAMPLDPKGRWELFPDPGHDDTEPPLPPWPR